MHRVSNNLRRVLMATCILCLIFLGGFFIVHGENAAPSTNFVPLTKIPGLNVEGDIKGSSMPDYLNKIYMLVVGLGALVAVIRIMWAGVMYSLTDIVDKKAKAKEDIKQVLFGLAILLIPFIVLYTINPDLVKLDILKGISDQAIAPPK